MAFDSESSILVPGDTNGWSDVFVRDRHTGTTTRASVSSSGTQATNKSWRASQAGDTIQAQAWFRDAQAPGGSSMSDAAEWVVTP